MHSGLHSRERWTLSWVAAIAIAAIAIAGAATAADDVLRPVDQRFRSADVSEVASFQRHVVPLFGRLGCNGRACHGSFQGQGGFRLSLFGYDFKADHEALLEGDDPRVDVQDPQASLILNKPTSADEHEGGLRYEKGSWQYHVFRRWIESGAEYDPEKLSLLSQLQIIPSEILFQQSGQEVQLQVIAVWNDGTKEDVTPLCRFQSNNDQVATIDENGLITATEPGDTHVVVSYDNGVVPIPVLRPVSELIGSRYPAVPTPTRVDELVVEKLRKLGIVPSELSSDEEFLRRVSLDLTGTLPSVEEIETFLADPSADKRRAKIEELLETPAYAAWWTTKLCDFTGNNDAQLINILPLQRRGGVNQASQDWYDWIYKRVAENMPYDELVEGIVTAVSRKSGQNYAEYCEQMSDIYQGDSDTRFADLEQMPYYWARRDFREVEARTINFAYAFMGIRIQCAQCHKHPFDQWSKEDFAQFTSFFGQTTFSQNRVRPKDKADYDKIVEALDLDKSLRGNQQRNEFGRLLNEGKTVPFPEIYVTPVAGGNRNRQRAAPTKSAKLLGGETVDLAKVSDPRVPLMEWLRSKDNAYFAKAFVNRVWANYFNVGIVEPPDDLSLANPPVNRRLLDHLAQGFIEHGFDMKWVHREILNSRTYQASWRPNETNINDDRNFSHSIPRRLPAEVAYDALVQATATSQQAAAMRENLDGRAITIAGASAQNRYRTPATYALTVFGRSVRESNCDCDRSCEPSLLQTVFLQNDQEVLAMLDPQQDGWIGEISQQLNPQPERSPAAGANQQITRLQNQIRRLQREGDSDRATALRRQLARLRRQAEAGAPSAQQESSSQPVPVDTVALIKQAYLRTLSRYPSDDEINRSRQFVEEADSAPDGMRGLLWALLNTKEFIVNH